MSEDIATRFGDVCLHVHYERDWSGRGKREERLTRICLVVKETIEKRGANRDTVKLEHGAVVAARNLGDLVYARSYCIDWRAGCAALQETGSGGENRKRENVYHT